MIQRRRVVDADTMLQLVVSAFLITLGLAGLSEWNSNLAQFSRSVNRLFGRTENYLDLIMAIAELVAGGIVLIGVFSPVTSRLIFWSTLIIMVLWAIQIVASRFARGFLEPDAIRWLNELSVDLIVLAGLWVINRRSA